MKPCRHRGELIQDDALKCKYCREFIPTGPPVVGTPQLAITPPIVRRQKFRSFRNCRGSWVRV